MTAEAFVVDWLARAAVGGLVFLGLAAVAVRLCRQPADRVRATELALLGALLMPWVSLVPGLPRLSVGVLPAPPGPGEPGASAPGAPGEPGALAPGFGAPELRSVPKVAARTAIEQGVPPASPPPASPEPQPSPVATAPALLDQGADTPRSPEPVGSSWSPYAVLVAGYAAVTVGFVGWTALGLWRLARLTRSARPAPSAAVALLRKIAGPAADRVRLLVSDRVESPVAFAGRRPVIVLPADGCDPDRHPGVAFGLAHEWNHVERGDVRRWYLTTLAQVVLFYQPLFWWLRRQLRLSQDYLADARAAQHAPDPADYAAYLVALARRRLPAPALALGVADRRSHLTRRVHMLLLNRDPLRPRSRAAWTAAAALVAVGLLAGLSAVRLTAADGPPTAPPSDAVKPDASKKDEPKGETLKYFGVVHDVDTQQPIAGASVLVRRSTSNDDKVLEESKHTTNKFGIYTFTIPPEQAARGDLYLELETTHPDYAKKGPEGYALGMIRKNEKLGQKPFFEKIGLRPGQPVTGVLKTPDGKPAAGVRVLTYSVTDKRKPNTFEYGSFADTKTDADGKYRVTVTTPGWAVVWFLPKDFAPVTKVVNGKRGDLGTYTLQDGPRLTGTVVDAKGKPLAGVPVRADSQDRNDEITEPVADQMNRLAVTNDKGEFALDPLPPGNYLVKPQEWNYETKKKVPVPGVFLGTKVKLAGGAKPAPVEVRAVPSVVVEAQHFDSKGKECRGHAPHVSGQLDGVFWFGEAKCKDGKVTAEVPHGLEQVTLGLMTNEHGALRWRRAKGEALSNTREIKLGTVADDVKGIEIVAYTAPILLVTVKSPDGVKVENVAVTALYTPDKGVDDGSRFFGSGGRRSDVGFEGNGKGVYQSSQLFPDQELTVTGWADGYESKPVKVTLAEGTTKEVEVVLEKAKEEAKKPEKK